MFVFKFGNFIKLSLKKNDHMSTDNKTADFASVYS